MPSAVPGPRHLSPNITGACHRSLDIIPQRWRSTPGIDAHLDKWRSRKCRGQDRATISVDAPWEWNWMPSSLSSSNTRNKCLVLRRSQDHTRTASRRCRCASLSSWSRVGRLTGPADAMIHILINVVVSALPRELPQFNAFVSGYWSRVDTRRYT
jgi:hypothetical protein